jgi:hypothetical protein
MTRVARTPAVIEDALHAAARAQLPAALLGGAALTAAVIDRSRRYTSERERLRATGGARRPIWRRGRCSSPSPTPASCRWCWAS